MARHCRYGALELAMSSDHPSDVIDPKLLEILVCDAEKQELISRAAKLAYPIRDGIPNHAAAAMSAETEL
jgi:uncharacterized protein YbaR (Trm112 family)